MAKRTKRPRAYIPLTERLAAALSMLLPQDIRDDLRARHIAAKTVIGMFDQDHVVLHALDGSDKWWNLTPTLRATHREKSRGDTSAVAKVRRLDHRWNEFNRKIAMGQKPTRPVDARPKRKIPNRPFPTRRAK